MVRTRACLHARVRANVLIQGCVAHVIIPVTGGFQVGSER